MKRLQVMINDEIYTNITDTIEKCNNGFDDGTVKIQDVINWVLANVSYDVHKIRARCLVPNKIKANARLEFKEDVEDLIKKLNLIKPTLKDKDEK